MPNKGALIPGGLYALVDDGLSPGVLALEVATRAIAGGARVLQLRLETTADRPALALIAAVLEAAKASQTVVIVNDRVDLALVSGAHGVHLGADDLPVSVARKLLGPDAFIGATTRSLADIRAAKEQGADHVGLGPIFVTSTKQVSHPSLGLEVLAAIARESPLPIVAIAGITLQTIGSVARAGAHAAAVASDLVGHGAVEARALALQAAFWSR